MSSIPISPSMNDKVSQSSRRLVATIFPGYGRRMAAYLIDLAIVSLLGMVLLFGLTYLTRSLFWAWMYGVIPLAIASIVYHVLMDGNGRTRGTVGKLLFGLQIVTVNNESIGYAKALIRSFARFIGPVTFGFAYLVFAKGDHGLSLHDRAANTIVTIRGSNAQEFAQAVQNGRVKTIGDVACLVFSIVIMMLFCLTSYQVLSRTTPTTLWGADVPSNQEKTQTPPVSNN